MVSRRNSSRLVAVLAWLIAMGVPLDAQAPAPTAPLRLSFADAVRLASGEVPVVALASLRTTEADARVRQARAALLPSVSVGGFWLNRSFNSRSIGISFPGIPELIGPFNNYDARFSATQTLFDWSSVRRVRAAGAQADGSRARRGAPAAGGWRGTRPAAPGSPTGPTWGPSGRAPPGPARPDRPSGLSACRGSSSPAITA